MLCLQVHPEFDCETVRMLTDARRHIISAEDLDRREASYAALQPADCSAQLQALCKAFLKGQPAAAAAAQQ